MKPSIRLGLFAVSTIAALSLSACKTDDVSQDAPPPATSAPANSVPDNSMPPETSAPPDDSMPTNASSGTPQATP